MDNQQYFNISILIIGALAGWVMRVMWQSVTDLQKSEKQLTHEISEIKILVAGDYCKKADMHELNKALFAKLDKIEEKIDRKADK